MQHIIDAIIQRTLARFLLLAAVIAPLLFYFGLTPVERSSLILNLVRYCGPILALGAVAGFLAWSWRAFWIALLIGLTLTLFSVIILTSTP